jgi:tetratricopeptide (TPR) repeat protein
LSQECAKVSRSINLQGGAPYGLRNQAGVAEAQGDFETARRHYEASLAFDQGSGNPKETAHDLLGLGRLALATSSAAEARRFHEASLALSRQAGYRRGLVQALVGLGDTAMLDDSGDASGQARSYYQEALSAAQAAQAVPWVLAAAVGLAALSSQAGRHGPAIELLTHAVYHPASSHRTRERAARWLSRLEAELPAPQVAEAEERGRRSELEEVVAAILQQD